MINNRQAGRRRGRGGQQQRPQGGSGRPDNGNRIDNRARGNAAQLLEKYKTLARDAQMHGDRVNVEYYLQFADHYFRVLAETRARFEENGGAVSTRRIQGATLDEDEQDYEDEGERIEQPQSQNEQNRGDQNRGQPSRDGQQRDNRDIQRDGQPRAQQNGYRQDGRQDRDRSDGNRGYSQNGGQNGRDGGQPNGNPSNGQQNGAYEQRGTAQEPRDRMNGSGEGGGYERQADAPREVRERQPRGERFERSRDAGIERPADMPVQAPAQVEVAAEPVAEAPRRGRGRPRREVAPVVERDSDSGIESVGFLAERLAPSLSPVATPEAANDGAGDGEAAEKPRRRRGRPPASETSIG